MKKKIENIIRTAIEGAKLEAMCYDRPVTLNDFHNEVDALLSFRTFENELTKNMVRGLCMNIKSVDPDFFSFVSGKSNS